MADNPKKSIKASPGSSPEIAERFTSQYPTIPPAEIGMLRIQDLNTILEVNQKALTIYLEVENQNEEIIKSLEVLPKVNENLSKANETVSKILDKQILSDKTLDDLKKRVEELDKNFFRLILVLGSTGIGTILNLIQSYLSTK